MSPACASPPRPGNGGPPRPPKPLPDPPCAKEGARRSRTPHHGDLRAALVAAGAELARKGGPDAIVLREITRNVGVAPNAVYAHFATLAELKIAVSQHALRDMAAAMSAEADRQPDACGAGSGERGLARTFSMTSWPGYPT
ncbi:TetR/AcrR family transcriptional regulator [Streptomyces sp. NPDC001339]|uniref:TetR/AcrR family transcriptional regulator n=1 Tax=Streptomyces sp. NPDC001339 TaxID=3364563 RepID=UPI0036C0AD8C